MGFFFFFNDGIRAIYTLLNERKVYNMLYFIIGIICIVSGAALVVSWLKSEIVAAINNAKNEIEVEILKSEARMMALHLNDRVDY